MSQVAEQITVDDAKKQELAEFLKHWGTRPVSENGYRVADLLSDWLGGLHHLPQQVGMKANWWDHYVELKWRGLSLATFDSDRLTRLVLLSHDKLIRVEIDAVTVGMFRLLFHPRQARDGSLFRRLPTIETQLAAWRERHQSINPSGI